MLQAHCQLQHISLDFRTLGPHRCLQTSSLVLLGEHASTVNFFSSYFSSECCVEANVDAQPPVRCLLALTRAVLSEEVGKCWGKTSKNSFESCALVPTALICAVLWSCLLGGEWSWQLSSRAGLWWPLVTRAQKEMESYGLAYSIGVSSVGWQCLVQRIEVLVGWGFFFLLTWPLLSHRFDFCTQVSSIHTKGIFLQALSHQALSWWCRKIWFVCTEEKCVCADTWWNCLQHIWKCDT